MDFCIEFVIASLTLTERIRVRYTHGAPAGAVMNCDACQKCSTEYRVFAKEEKKSSPHLSKYFTQCRPVKKDFRVIR